jgi:Protein of unknown function (DUF2782)
MHRLVAALTLLLIPKVYAQPLPPLPELERPPQPVPAEGAGRQSPEGAPPPAEGVPATPPPSAGGIEPEVTITQRGGVIVQEFRVNGRLYMIRVIPPIGFPYYLVDTNADGVWDTRLNDLAPIAPPQWLLFSW